MALGQLAEVSNFVSLLTCIFFFQNGCHFQKRIACSWTGEMLPFPSLCSWSFPFLFCDWEGAVINEVEILAEFKSFEGLHSPVDFDKWRQVRAHWKEFIWMMVNRSVYGLGQGQRHVLSVALFEMYPNHTVKELCNSNTGF